MVDKLDASTVTVKLDGADIDLVCTIEATLVMNRAYGGMQKVFERVQDMDLEAMVTVIQAGTGMIGAANTEDILAKVFRTGLIDIRPGLAQFVLLAASGGVQIDIDDDDKPDDGEPGKP